MATTSSATEQPQTSRRPISPYAGPIIQSTFRNSPQRWPVHSAFLSRHPKLYSLLQTNPPPPANASSSSDIHLHLEHADPQIAHTLIHYLSTGKYQILRALDPASEYERALLAYSAAGWYELRGLRKLAVGEIERVGAAVALEDALVEVGKAVECACARDQEWLLEHLEARLKEAHGQDKKVFGDRRTWRNFNPFIRTLVMVVVALQGGKGESKGEDGADDGEGEENVQDEEVEEEE